MDLGSHRPQGGWGAEAVSVKPADSDSTRPGLGFSRFDRLGVGHSAIQPIDSDSAGPAPIDRLGPAPTDRFGISRLQAIDSDSSGPGRLLTAARGRSFTRAELDAMLARAGLRRVAAAGVFPLPNSLVLAAAA